MGMSIEGFKYGQELVKSLWAGIAVVLLGILLKGSS
jgi:hypothetical protein